jgi:hypothetical protein
MSEPHRNVTPEVRLADSSRVEAFTDAVLAIVMTILVLELRPPPYEEGSLLKGLLSQWASYVAFLVSFLYVGIVWMNHHALFSRIRFVDRGMQWLNFSILLTAALLPFPTAVLADALREGNPTDQRVAVALYALVAGLMSAAWIRVFPYLREHWLWPWVWEPGRAAGSGAAGAIRVVAGLVSSVLAAVAVDRLAQEAQVRITGTS